MPAAFKIAWFGFVAGTVATVLRLLFLPALDIASRRIKTADGAASA
jgi:hypothetical protein